MMSIDTLGSIFDRIPGSAILVRYVHASYQGDPVRSVMELILLLVALHYLLAIPYNPKKAGTNHIQLTEQEIDELVDDWTPAPLVEPETVAELKAKSLVPVLHQDASSGPKTKLKEGRNVINLACYDHYTFSRDPALVNSAIQTVREYGVGPCSAPVFYGTFDVHMNLEKSIASHFGTEAAIIYSQAFVTISSVIPSFCKRGDIIVADQAVNHAIRKGIQASRSSVRWYKHNDMDDLEKILAEILESKRPLTRRFIITEGLSENVGDMVDLPRLVELKHRYKFRILLDETWSYGVLGRTGRGVTELQNVDPINIDGIVGSLAGALASGGGFCAGSEAVVNHQYINSPAATFSASLAAFLATSASHVIAKLQSPEGSAAIKALQVNVAALRQQLQRSKWLKCTSDPRNPVQLLVLKDEHIDRRCFSRADQHALLLECVKECMSRSGLIITWVKSAPRQEGLTAAQLERDWQMQPALKVCATVGLTAKEMANAGTSINTAVDTVMSKSMWQRGKEGRKELSFV